MEKSESKVLEAAAALYNAIPGHRKTAILKLERQYGLTEREGLILRYLANDRNPSYISNALGISASTAKAHKYSIYRKLGIHSTSELKNMLNAGVPHEEKDSSTES